jgi:alkylhydroperoxidase family enzyme
VAVLTFAQRAARKPAAVTDVEFNSLRAAGLSSDEVFEVLATIQLFSAVNLFTDVASVDIDQV